MNPYIIDHSIERSVILRDYLKDIEANISNDIYSEEIIEVGIMKEILLKNNVQLLFLHKSNNFAAELIAELQQKNIFILLYSGGGINNAMYLNREDVLIYPGIFDVTCTDDFLNLVKKLVEILNSSESHEQKKTKMQFIFGFDVILEARLELLHNCLHPDSIPFGEELDLHLTDEDKEAFKIFFATSPKTKNLDGYISELVQLRKSLLGS